MTMPFNAKNSLKMKFLEKSPSIIEFEFLLEEIANPTLILESTSETIRATNELFSKLSGYRKTELLNIKIHHLLPGIDFGIDKGDLVNKIEGTDTLLVQRSGLQVEVVIKAKVLGEDSDWFILYLDPISNESDKLINPELSEQRDQAVSAIVGSLNLESHDPSHLQILQAGQVLTGASIVALYTHNAENNDLVIENSWGKSDLLPENINSSQINIDDSIQIWTRSDPNESDLHRAAFALNSTYLAVSKINKRNLDDGLLIFVDQIASPPDDLINQIEIITQAIYSSETNDKLLGKLNERLKTQTLDLDINLAVKDAINDGIIFVSTNWEIIDINTTAETILGYSIDEVKGNKLETVLIGPKTLSPMLSSVVHDQLSVQNLGELNIHRRDGTSLLANIRAMPITSSGTTSIIAILISDLTEQEEIRIKNKLLEKQALLGEVIELFAHEVRNPINNISTGLQLIGFNLDQNDPLRQQTDRLEKDCERIIELMKSVLSFTGPKKYKMVPVNLYTMLENLFARWKTRLNKQNVEYILQVEDNMPMIRGDISALEQVFGNLIGNSIQAIGNEGGLISIKAKRSKNKSTSIVNIDFSDTGPGIPENMVDKIFNPFVTSHEEGTGLGLVITKRIVEAHGGSIKASSIAGGTIFQIDLPLEND